MQKEGRVGDERPYNGNVAAGSTRQFALDFNPP